MTHDSKRAMRLQLRLHRLDRGLSLIDLSKEIEKKTGISVSPPTLVRFMEAERRTNEVHVYAIKKYLSKFRPVHLL